MAPSPAAPPIVTLPPNPNLPAEVETGKLLENAAAPVELSPVEPTKLLEKSEADNRNPQTEKN